MRKRKILLPSLISILLMATLLSCSNIDCQYVNPVKPDSDCVTDNGTLAGLTLEQLRRQYRHDLFEDFLPFMDKYVIDHEYGSFMCNTARDGRNVTTNKTSWYTGRGIWVYSFLYNELAREEKYLEVARKAVEFILLNEPPDGQLWRTEYSREGKPIGPIDKEIYGDLFIAEGLVEYARATGQMEYWQKAKRILLKCVKIYDRPDYAPDAAQTYFRGNYKGQCCPGLPGVRLLGVWMVMLRQGTQMLYQQPDADIEQLNQRCLDAIMNYHYNPEYGLLGEVLNHDMSRPKGEYGDLCYLGHAIETIWMVMAEAERIKDKDLFDKAAKMLKRHMEISWDDVYGGFLEGLRSVENYDFSAAKSLWSHEEPLIGTLMVTEHTGSIWAKQWFAKTYSYVQDKFPLKKHGYSLWNLWAVDRKVTFVKKYERIGNYHHPRHLMLNLLGIERMIKRHGKVSDTFK